jgi:hypothetical protein
LLLGPGGWRQDPVAGVGLESRKEESGAEAELSYSIAEAVGQTFDNAMQAQPPKRVCGGALADVLWKTSGERREMFAQVCAAEAIGKQSKKDDGMPEGLNARIGEAQSRGALPIECNRTVDGLESILSQHAIMAEALDLEQAAIGRKTDFTLFWQIAQTLANAEIVSVVDGGLGAQGAVFLVILLDARVLVIDSGMGSRLA